jgi:hypothetical protein
MGSLDCRELDSMVLTSANVFMFSHILAHFYQRFPSPPTTFPSSFLTRFCSSPQVLWMVSRDCNKLDSVELTSSARSAYSMGLEYGPIWCLTVGCPSMRTFIDFCGRSTTDNTLNLIGRAWKDLTTLAIHGVMFTMRGLIQLRGCTKLQSLEVCDGKLGLIGEALEPRQPGFMLHDTLERLSFNRTPVTTDEVKLLLRACPALKRVEVKGLSNAITGVGEEAKEEMLAVKKRIADFGALNAMPVFKSRGLVVYAE